MRIKIDRHFPLGENDSFRYNSSFYQTQKIITSSGAFITMLQYIYIRKGDRRIQLHV